MSLIRIPDVIRSANLICQKYLAIKSNEEVLILTDTESPMEMAFALSGIAASIGAEPIIAIWPAKEPGRDLELSEIVLKAAEGADVVIALTKSADPERHPRMIEMEKKEKRFRYFAMARRDLDMCIKGGATADPEEMERILRKVLPIFKAGNTVRVKTNLGTDVICKRGNRQMKGYIVAHEPGTISSFPTGQLTFGPIEDSVEGIIVVDGAITYFDEIPDEPIRLEVKKGKVVSIKGGKDARRLEGIVKENVNADQVCEFAMGLNPKSRLGLGNMPEEKKGLGTVHFALGDNIRHGGTSKSTVHIDIVIYDVTIEVNGNTIMKDGKLMV